MQIIAHDPIPTPLFTNAKPNHNKNPPLIPRCSPNTTPLLLLRLHLQLNRAHNFAELKLDYRVLAIAVRVIVREDRERGVFAPFGDEPAGRFREEQDAECLQDGGECLED
jgi:hypothetical protein